MTTATTRCFNDLFLLTLPWHLRACFRWDPGEAGARCRDLARVCRGRDPGGRGMRGRARWEGRTRGRPRLRPGGQGDGRCRGRDRGQTRSRDAAGTAWRSNSPSWRWFYCLDCFTGLRFHINLWRGVAFDFVLRVTKLLYRYHIFSKQMCVPSFLKKNHFIMQFFLSVNEINVYNLLWNHFSIIGNKTPVKIHYDSVSGITFNSWR